MPDDDDLPPEPGEPTSKRRGPPSKLDAVREHIGVLADREVAAMVGLTPSAVQMYRSKNGIPASGAKSGRKPGQVKQVPALKQVRVVETVSTNGTVMAAWAWKVALGPDLVRYVVAGDATTAAEIAGRHGEVVTMERIGEGFS